jgi:F5/8 type C domain
MQATALCRTSPVAVVFALLGYWAALVTQQTDWYPPEDSDLRDLHFQIGSGARPCDPATAICRASTSTTGFAWLRSSCQALAPAGVACDPLPATFGCEWDESAPIKEGPPDTHTPQFYSFIGLKANHSIDGYPPQNAADGNLSTYWSSNASDAYLELDLGSVVPISKVYIAWIKGDQRQESFQVFMDSGTTTYSTGTITSSGTTAGLDAYSTPCNA